MTGMNRRRPVSHLFHEVDLRRRGVGAQQNRLRLTQIEVEGVPHPARRMGGRNVERLEVVPVGLDLGAFGDGESH
jgi:hypothetical protein